MLYWSLPATEERSTRAPHEDGSLQPGEPRNKDATAPDQHILFHIIFDCKATHTQQTNWSHIFGHWKERERSLEYVSTHLLVFCHKFIFN